MAPPFDIDDVLRQAELPRHDDGDRRKGFVDLDPLDVTELPPGAVDCLAHRRDRSKAEHPRLHRRDAVRDKARCRTEAAAFREILICQYHRRSPAVEAGRVAGGDRAIGTKRWL
jgi:hypothetical protein